MKLTKFVHACVLVEDEKDAILFDPGGFSWSSGLGDVAKLPKLDAVVITHQHSDHLSEEFVQALVKKQPDLLFVAPPDTLEILKDLGVTNLTSESTPDIQVLVGDHAPVKPFADPVQNLQVTYKDKVTMPGDSHDIAATKDVLLLPVQAPWGKTTDAMQLILDLKPQFVLPIHDWMWNEQWRSMAYDRFEEICKQVGATFVRPVDGQAQEI